ncbi:Pycsar system effector family protein [Halorientalis pallida]|uniref:Pycsar system effector family protein n=1 Tax=Halorientalis pallida TaxID=2479928 RepID=UPI003C6F0079
MSDFTSSELAEGTQDHLNEYIIAADRKASILITGQFAFLGLTATALSNLSQVPTGWFRWFVIATAVFGVLAVLLAVVVIYPRTPSPSEGYIYWGNITQHSSDDDFHEAITSLDDDEAIEALNKENYSLAKVAEKKYTHLRWSLRATVAMVVFAVVAGAIFII